MILTADIIEFLTEFRKKYSFDIDIVFKEDRGYIRFFTGEMFKTRIFRESISKEILYIEYGILKFIEEFTRKMDLKLEEIS